MESNSQQYKTLGSVGGPAASATAGGYNQGNQIAGVRATGDSSPRMAGSPKAGGDVRVGGHFGPTTDAANAASGYNQGDEFAAAGGTTDTGSPVKGGLKPGGNILTGGGASAAMGTGFNQGNQLVAKVK